MKSFFRSALFSASAAALALGLPELAQAATLAVPAQYATIQAAVNAAASGDTVLLADGTYAGPGNVDIDFGGKSLTVTSQNGPAATVINCGGSSSANHRAFYLHSGETGAVLSGLTLENGYESNSSGGALYLVTNSVTVQNCVLENSTASSAGGVYSSNTGSGTTSLIGCTFSGNMAGGFGGGLYASSNSAGATTLTDCTFSGNTSTSSNGGGAYLNESGSGTTSLIGCTFSGNSSAISDGGGLFNSNSSSSTGTVTVTDCTFTGNSAASNLVGGGLFNSNSGSGSGTISVVNCLLTGNSAGGGGGIFNLNQSGGPITVTNCTLTGNSAGTTLGGGGGIGNFNYGAATLTNDIVYGDTGGEIGNYQSASGSPTTVNAAAANCDIQGSYPGAGNISADPQFVYAPTNLRLKAGSPCLGAGAAAQAPPSDIAGVARPDPPSIGAYEAAAPGTTHVLWDNANGMSTIWNYNTVTGTFTQNVFGPYPGWSAKAIADGGTDGRTRVLWETATVRLPSGA